ncbi:MULTISPECIES: helix-turn-helix domain-containing protein [Burkholderia]|uniref:helix-turn-helix domain-containing protein n=1 Tax=Burkholderia TaxID=32008 RepID=UPI000B7A0534|nr:MULTISPECIES: helix-turn-helix domain-containing protein [Burkholderia]MBY4726371.1 helix-turn-helix domain-containing protein [Burkholderia contaminans]MCI3974032.1 helix-turn-helix domain-containing protein [Burkholderia sp. HI4860]MDN7791094.1 helix-turn-helix domain-containing protein [Burkholderia contaminans]OXI93694.1 transcriptional regulator [Burkholderia sp. AU33647]
MRYTIEQASDIGGVIRAARKVQQLRQDDAAGSVGVSESFMVKAERGADTIQWAKVFQILQGLGVRVVVDIPDASDELLERQSARASHRAGVRARRAAERLLLRADAAHPAPAAESASPARVAARVLSAARLVLSPAEASGVGTDDTRRPRIRTTDAGRQASARAIEIARRVLTDAGETVPDHARPAGEDASHD